MGRPTKYPDQFRNDALELVKTSGRPVAEVARLLGIAEATLWNWVRAARDAKERLSILMPYRSRIGRSCAGSVRRISSYEPMLRS
jgi:transposase-like protein